MFRTSGATKEEADAKEVRPTTISRVLQHEPGVSDEIRHRVQIAEKMLDCYIQTEEKILPFGRINTNPFLKVLRDRNGGDPVGESVIATTILFSFEMMRCLRYLRDNGFRQGVCSVGLDRLSREIGSTVVDFEILVGISEQYGIIEKSGWDAFWITPLGFQLLKNENI